VCAHTSQGQNLGYAVIGCGELGCWEEAVETHGEEIRSLLLWDLNLVRDVDVRLMSG